MKDGRGGARPGSGRPTKAAELQVRNLALSAIQLTYGSLEAGFEALLRSGEPALVKFAWEHAVGKPQVSVDLTSNGESITQIFQLPDNTRPVNPPPSIEDDNIELED